MKIIDKYGWYYVRKKSYKPSQFIKYCCDFYTNKKVRVVLKKLFKKLNLFGKDWKELICCYTFMCKYFYLNTKTKSSYRVWKQNNRVVLMRIFSNIVKDFI